MTPYTIHGITLNADAEGIGAFNCFNPDSPAATDRGPAGMVEELRAFLRLTADRKRLLDVGALFGLFSLLFASRPGTSAVAIEPSPWAFPFLDAHVRANPQCAVRHLAHFVGEQTGRTVSTTRDWKHVIANLDRPGERVTLTETAIDDLPVGDIDCMKIDVEAYECAVLRGARKTILRCRPLIFLEVHCANLPDNGESVESLLAILGELGYGMEDYAGKPIADLDWCRGSMTRVVCGSNA